MKYTKDEVIQFCIEEDVKFVRLAFCDVWGRQKNISIMSDELERAFGYGIALDGSAIPGFGGEVHSDLLLHPDADTLMILPWRPEQGKVVRMFCSITYPDGKPFECDTRSLLKNAVKAAEEAGYSFYFGAEQEFYLFKLDENNEPTQIPYDKAGYMDLAQAVASTRQIISGQNILLMRNVADLQPPLFFVGGNIFGSFHPLLE